MNLRNFFYSGHGGWLFLWLNISLFPLLSNSQIFTNLQHFFPKLTTYSRGKKYTLQIFTYVCTWISHFTTKGYFLAFNFPYKYTQIEWDCYLLLKTLQIQFPVESTFTTYFLLYYFCWLFVCAENNQLFISSIC